MHLNFCIWLFYNCSCCLCTFPPKNNMDSRLWFIIRILTLNPPTSHQKSFTCLDDVIVMYLVVMAVNKCVRFHLNRVRMCWEAPLDSLTFYVSGNPPRPLVMRCLCSSLNQIRQARRAGDPALKLWAYNSNSPGHCHESDARQTLGVLHGTHGVGGL